MTKEEFQKKVAAIGLDNCNDVVTHLNQHGHFVVLQCNEGVELYLCEPQTKDGAIVIHQQFNGWLRQMKYQNTNS